MMSAQHSTAPAARCPCVHTGLLLLLRNQPPSFRVTLTMLSVGTLCRQCGDGCAGARQPCRCEVWWRPARVGGPGFNKQQLGCLGEDSEGWSRNERERWMRWAGRQVGMQWDTAGTRGHTGAVGTRDTWGRGVWQSGPSQGVGARPEGGRTATSQVGRAEGMGCVEEGGGKRRGEDQGGAPPGQGPRERQRHSLGRQTGEAQVLH